MKDGGPAVRPFPFKDVAILVVDECSLVAVSNLSFLLYILTKHAKLKRIIFLGDIQQLPSIEAGTFVQVFMFRPLEHVLLAALIIHFVVCWPVI